MQQSVAVRNFLALQKKSYNIKFALDNTNYEPIENIGSGAYGVVCSAVHKKNKDKVAIKKIPNIFEQPTIAKRTYREIKILKHFKHDNIIAIREILKPTEPLSEFKDVYIVLDLMESDLHRIIHSQQPLTNEHVCFFLYQLLRGLKYIHSANVIHRDLKPSNLLVNENCELKIGDFGMARAISSSSDEYKYSLTQYVATRWYRAPEIMLSVIEYNTAVDVWSVGCIFAEMLGRKQLFPGKDNVHQMRLIINILGSLPKEITQISKSGLLSMFKVDGHKEPKSLKKLYPDASPEALDLLGKMLHYSPQKRITVERALKHPYLQKYHDSEDEPVCIPVFDFDFEKQNLTPEQLKQVIVKEAMAYHKPKPEPDLSSFNLKPAPKTVTPCSVLPSGGQKKQNIPTVPTGMDAFLQQLQQRKLPTPAANIQPATEQQNLQNVSNIFKRPTVPACKSLSVKMDVTSLSSASDVEMLSAKSTDGSKDGNKTEPSGTKDINTIKESSTAEGEPKVKPVVLSEGKPLDAKAQIRAALLNNAGLRKQRNETGADGASKPKPVTALQRQREREEKRRKKKEAAERRKKEKAKKQPQSASLLTEEDRDLLNRWANMQTGTKPFVHPIRHHMKELTQLKQDMTVAGRVGSLQQNNNQSNVCENTTTEHQNIKQGAAMVDVMKSDDVTGNKIVNVTSDGIFQQADGSNNIVQVVGQSHAAVRSQHDLDPGHNSELKYEANVVCGLAGDGPNDIARVPGISHLVPSNCNVTPQMSTTGQQESQHMTLVEAWTRPPEPNQVFQHLPSYTEALQAKAQAGPEHARLTSGLRASCSDPQVVNSFIHQGVVHEPMSHVQVGTSDNHIQTVPTVPPGGHIGIAQVHDSPPLPGCSPPIIAPLVPAVPERHNVGEQLPSSVVGLQDSPQHPGCSPPYPQSSPVFSGDSPGTVTHNLPRITINPGSPRDLMAMLTKQMSKSQVEDTLPPTLAMTPRGTGAGYGVGLDLDQLMEEGALSVKDSGGKPDSAPLSASLIADWLEVSGNMDPKELEALTRELEMGSPLLFSDVSMMSS